MSDRLELALECPLCHAKSRQRALLVKHERMLNCAKCGPVEATQDILAKVNAAMEEAERKFSELSGNFNFKLK